jgi:hypothetical protein
MAVVEGVALVLRMAAVVVVAHKAPAVPARALRLAHPVADPQGA